MSRFPAILLGSAALLLTALPAGATLISWNATGTVTEATTAGGGSLPSGVGVSDTVSISWSYEDTAGFTPLGNGRRYASGLMFTASVQIETHTWAGTGNAIDVFDDNPFDAWTMRLQQSEGATFTSFPNPGAGAFDLVLFQLADDTSPYQLLSSLALPSSDADLDPAALSTSTSVTFGDIRGENALGAGYRLKFSIDPGSVARVPEPSLAWLAGLGALALARRGR